jgi:hypothetical protein
MPPLDRSLQLWKTGLFIIGCALLAGQIAGSFIGGNRPLMAFGGMIPLSILVWFQFEDELSVRKLAWATAAMAIAALMLYAAIVIPLGR